MGLFGIEMRKPYDRTDHEVKMWNADNSWKRAGEIHESREKSWDVTPSSFQKNQTFSVSLQQFISITSNDIETDLGFASWSLS